MRETPESQNERSISSKIRTQIPAHIVDFDPEHQLCSVQILAKFRLYGEIITPKILSDVKLVIKGDHEFIVTYPMREFPIPAYLVVMDRSIDNWHESSGIYDPQDKRMHDLSDAFVELGGRSEPYSIKDYNSENMEIRSIDGKTKIEISKDGKFKFASENDEVLSILSDLVGHLSGMKTEVKNGSSQGDWGTDKSSAFDDIKNRLEAIKI